MSGGGGEVTPGTLTMRQIADLKRTSTGQLLADCVRAESLNDTLRILPKLRRICAAINARTRPV